MIERMHTGERMSKIIKHNGLVYLCGQVGAGETIEDQTRDCLSRIDTLLAEAGSDKSNILQAIIWLSAMKDFAAMNEIWEAWVPNGYAPTRPCGEPKLARSALKIEIIITAVSTA